MGAVVTYSCKNCGLLCYGRPTKVIVVGKRLIVFGPCCWKPGKPMAV